MVPCVHQLPEQTYSITGKHTAASCSLTAAHQMLQVPGKGQDHSLQQWSPCPALLKATQQPPCLLKGGQLFLTSVDSWQMKKD